MVGHPNYGSFWNLKKAMNSFTRNIPMCTYTQFQRIHGPPRPKGIHRLRVKETLRTLVENQRRLRGYRKFLLYM